MIVLLIFIIVLGWFVFQLYGNNKKLLEKSKLDEIELKTASAMINRMHTQLSDNDEQVKNLTFRIRSLEKYQDVIDIMAFIKQQKDLLHAEIESEKNKIEIHKNKTAEEANTLISQIKREIEDTKAFLNKHKEISSQRVEKEAKDLLQEFYEISNEKLKLKKIVKALENKIKGYGDEYLMPNQVLLNDLIEGYDHLDAVNRLKSIRIEIKLAIKKEIASDCDYVEEIRKKTAKAFITNAFNGQADAILSRVRHDNVGKLTQEMRDSFLSLNNFGEAFKNARITGEYLSLRITELKWASMVQEFKVLEREEQREIRELIREEEKARKEYERATKEAEREEAALKKAYEKAKREFESASDDQKAEYEQKLSLLNEKLQIAEDKSKRTLSMAQQTRAGHVYVISNVGSFGENVLKLGMTRRLEPMDRVRELGDASVPFIFDVHAMIYSEDAPTLEKKLHHYFNHERVNKVNYRKEFFAVSVSEVKEFLETENIQAKFTLKAEAAQYRESLRIEQLPEDEQRLIEDKIEKEVMKQPLDLVLEETD